MRHRIAILGHPDGWYVRDLRRASDQEVIEVVSFSDLSVQLDGKRKAQVESNLAMGQDSPSATPSRRVLGGEDGVYDSILVRTMPLGSLEQIIFRMNADSMQSFEAELRSSIHPVVSRLQSTNG